MGRNARPLPRAVLRLARLVPFAVAVAGCASLTLSPHQEQSLTEIRAMADETARLYKMFRISVLVGPDIQGVGGRYRQGLFTVSTPMLQSRHRDSLVAHELAHWVLGHDRPTPGPTLLDYQRQNEEREFEANAKAVEILVRVKRISEEQALRVVYDHLLGFHRAVMERRTVIPWGHKPPCEEIADLLGRFPQHRSWAASLECSGSPTAAVAAAPPTRPFHPPSRDGSLSDQVVYTYFTDSPPPAGTFLRTTTNPNMPRGVQDFHADWDQAVALFLALKQEGRTFRIVSRWYDEQGIERKVIERTMAQAGITGRWTWQTHVGPAAELAPSPGRWTVKVSVDGTVVGEYRFTLTRGSGAAQKW